MIDTVRALVQLHEGCRLTVYDDATGKPIGPGDTLVGHPTIGFGRALDVRGVTQAEAGELLDHDLVATAAEISGALPWAVSLDPVRLAALRDMAHNLGVRGVCGFRKALAALKAGDFDRCADELLDSRWQTQVPVRAGRLAGMMRSGSWPSLAHAQADGDPGDD